MATHGGQQFRNNKKGGLTMRVVRQSRVLVGAFALVFVLTMVVGCASMRKDPVDSEESAQLTAQAEDTPGPLYYDFGDVLVPLELKVDKKKSFVYHAPGFTAGVIGLSGRVDVNSLIRFFENNMAKDNWKLVSAFKSPRTILFFNKPNRSCIINITEGSFNSIVEIWVAPTVEEGETTLFK
jgi:hypothetical protein